MLKAIDVFSNQKSNLVELLFFLSVLVFFIYIYIYSMALRIHVEMTRSARLTNLTIL